MLCIRITPEIHKILRDAQYSVLERATLGAPKELKKMYNEAKGLFNCRSSNPI